MKCRWARDLAEPFGRRNGGDFLVPPAIAMLSVPPNRHRQSSIQVVHNAKGSSDGGITIEEPFWNSFGQVNQSE